MKNTLSPHRETTCTQTYARRGRRKRKFLSSLLVSDGTFLFHDDIALSILQFDFSIGISHFLFPCVENSENGSVWKQFAFECVGMNLFGLIGVLNELFAVRLQCNDGSVWQIDILRSIGQCVFLSTIGKMFLDLSIGELTDPCSIGMFGFSSVRTGIFIDASAIRHLLFKIAVVEIDTDMLTIGTDLLFRSIGKMNDS